MTEMPNEGDKIKNLNLTKDVLNNKKLDAKRKRVFMDIDGLKDYDFSKVEEWTDEETVSFLEQVKQVFPDDEDIVSLLTELVTSLRSLKGEHSGEEKQAIQGFKLEHKGLQTEISSKLFTRVFETGKKQILISYYEPLEEKVNFFRVNTLKVLGNNEERINGAYEAIVKYVNSQDQLSFDKIKDYAQQSLNFGVAFLSDQNTNSVDICLAQADSKNPSSDNIWDEGDRNGEDVLYGINDKVKESFEGMNIAFLDTDKLEE